MELNSPLTPYASPEESEGSLNKKPSSIWEKTFLSKKRLERGNRPSRGSIKKTPLWIFEPHAQIDAQVDRIVKELLEKGYDIFAKRDDRHLISIEGVEDLYSMSVGGERIVLKALADLGFDNHLKKAGLSLKHRRLAHALIAARCLAPGSELYTDRWLHEESSLYSLLDIEADPPSLNSLYRIA